VLSLIHTLLSTTAHAKYSLFAMSSSHCLAADPNSGCPNTSVLTSSLDDSRPATVSRLTHCSSCQFPSHDSPLTGSHSVSLATTGCQLPVWSGYIASAWTTYKHCFQQFYCCMHIRCLAMGRIMLTCLPAIA
jgi:hypothetical protein